MSEPSPPLSPPPAPPETAGWGLGEAALGWVASVVIAGVVSTMWVAVSGVAAGFGYILVGLGGTWAGIAAVLVWVSRTKGTGSARRDYGLSITWSDVPLGVVVGVCSAYAVEALYLPLRALAPHTYRHLGDPTHRLLDPVRGGRMAVLGVLLVLGAGLFEELFYRGLVLRALRRRFGEVASVLLCGLAFGLAHLEPLQLVGLSAFGAVLALLTLRRGRLGAAIVAHIAFDAVAVVTFVVTR